MYDIVSELNASKTQVFECKQDCGRYLSFHCHMQSHSCDSYLCIISVIQIIISYVSIISKHAVIINVAI